LCYNNIVKFEKKSDVRVGLLFLPLSLPLLVFVAVAAVAVVVAVACFFVCHSAA